MRRVLASIAFALGLVAASPAFASHNADEHTPNMTLVANRPYQSSETSTTSNGTDLAFQGDLLVAGNLSPGGFRLFDISTPSNPTLISQFVCNGSQSDVSIWGDLVFVSVDGPRSSPACDAPAASLTETTTGSAWEGIRIVDISDPAKPRQIDTVRTDCGSHTHTLVPDKNQKTSRVYLYVLSYPLTPVMPNCNVATHRKISVVEVPLQKPGAARVVSTPDVSPAIGCHDVTVFPREDMAGAACITESQTWDISNRARPRVVSHIVNPAINIHHSTTFSWDGTTLAIGDELGGAAVAPGCPTDAGHLPLGAIWFYRVNPETAVASPAPVGFFEIENQELSTLCTAHNFNTVPMTNDRDILTTAWYDGGTAVVEFTNPAAPVQLGRYTPKTAPGPATPWSSYWFNRYIYANNYTSPRGLDVFRIEDPFVALTQKTWRLNPQTMIGG
ncbi:MAG TPA: hypothetical protein VG709_03365 [Actinomycetota bacterium]|nr:hypothetical protein [Actinomycetota bacterium]